MNIYKEIENRGYQPADLDVLLAAEKLDYLVFHQHTGYKLELDFHELTIADPSMLIDPFEVRMRFTQQLQHLSASVTSSQKAAQYALKYRDLDEDLHSCILEQLERNNMNIRANIMSFIEQFCDMATKEDHVAYVRMIQRDILRVVDAVVPPDGSGAANVKHVRRVLGNLQNKGILTVESVGEIDAALNDRDTHPEHYAIGEDGAPDETGHGMRLDKRQIEQRIEEDRERNKRERESDWIAMEKDFDEWLETVDELSEPNSNDFFDAEEEAMAQKFADEMGIVIL